MAQQEDKLAQIVLDAMYQFVGLLDADGHTLDINRAALEGAGVTLADIKGQPFWQARWFQVSAESVAFQRSLVDRARRGEFVRCDLEVYGQASGDETIVVDYSLQPVRDAHGEVVFLLAEGRNITAKTQAEAEKQRQAERALLQSRAELAQVSRVSTLGELTASIAHEVNQPLAAIVTNAQAALRWLAAEPSNDAEVKAAIHRIVRDASIASKVIQRIRGFVRRRETLPEPMDVNEVIRSVLDLVQGELRMRHVEVRLDLSTALPKVMADRIEIQQVILNLVMNAIEAMAIAMTTSPPTHSPQLQIRTHHEGTAVRIDVQDNGTGVDAAVESTLFHPFETTKPQGMGMGLAISRSMVESHGGRLWFTPHSPQAQA